MASENFDQQRLKDLEDNLDRERELLKQFEETLSYATNPREIAGLKRDIERQNQAIANYQQEYNSLKKKLTNAKSAPNTIQDIKQPAAHTIINYHPRIGKKDIGINIGLNSLPVKAR